jgi:RNA polymerase sigma-70 factor (ECF subfamily)
MESHEQKAFLEAFEAYTDSLFRHALFRVSDRERAYDLTQDTFLKAWDYMVRGGTVKQYKSFLYRILHNLIIDEYRKKQTYSLDEMLEDEGAALSVEKFLSEGSLRETEECIDKHLLFKQIEAHIPELPEQYRAVLTFHFLDELSTNEIAKAIGVSENLVSVRIHRGLAKLRTLCNICKT